MESTLILGVVLVLAVILIIWYISAYNRLIRIRNEAKRAWHNIDVILQQRYDMLTNLVKLVKGATKHESDIFTEFAKARQMASSAQQAGDVGALSQAEGMLSSIMPKIYAVAEQYPALQANASFIEVMEATESIENQLADRREFYNAAVTIWNTVIEVIPTNIVASMMKAEPMVLFTTEGTARDAPDLDFDAQTAAEIDESQHQMEMREIEQEMEMLAAKKKLEEMKRNM